MNYTFISKTTLFYGCNTEEIEFLSKNLHFKVIKYKKKDIIFHVGDIIHELGLVLSGSVHIEHNDFFGNSVILGTSYVGDVFAEAYACIQGEPLMIDAVAREDCEILFINVDTLFSSSLICDAQNKLIKNLLHISAEKNLQLSKRSIHTTPKTIRGRLMSFFYEQAYIQKSNHITLSFNRQQLADYLNLDRSALSKELMKMKKDALIEYHKNSFVLKFQHSHI